MPKRKPMTCKELIKILSKYPPNMEVMIDGYEGGVESPTSIRKEYVLNEGKRSYMGDYDVYDPGFYDEHEDRTPDKQVILITRKEKW
jgi:hypothetical protein